MQDIEWMNEKAQEAKQRGNYWLFECWRRAYLAAQAAVRQEKVDNEAEKRYNETA